MECQYRAKISRRKVKGMEITMETIELFVSGRISLLGGLSDLVSPYLDKNKNLIPGSAIAAGINKGIYATVNQSEFLEFEMKNKKLKINLKEDELEEQIKNNTFYSYICGVALCMKKKYKIGGIKIKVTKMDLPMKKGLASSAAICVLTARAWNQIYHLNLTTEEEKELAYEGEHLAGSKCGRLDQICASGKKLHKITFFKDYATTEEIKVKEPLNMVIADLNAYKDTKKIMKDLNKCFPFPHNEKEKVVHEMLGVKNKELVEEAKQCIENGDKERLGAVLNESQKLIDKASIICDELEAKVLHKVLEDETIKQYSYGGKGIGSGGDGAVQILAKDKQTQNLLVEYFKNDLKMDAFEVDLF